MVTIQHVEPRFRPKRRRRRFPVGSVALAVILIASVAVLSQMKPPPVSVSSAAAPPLPVWIDIPHPLQLFGLSAPELAGSSLVYEARRHRTGGGRQDVLTFGTLGGDAPFFRLVVYRAGSEAPPQEPLFVDLARMAAAQSLAITRSLAPAVLATRFGPMEATDVDLVAASGDPTPCLGFRGAGLDGGFKIGGFACGAPRKPLSRPALACLLDRLELNDAGDDQALATFFADTELRRDPDCAGTGLAPTPAEANWIDENDAPPPLRLQKAR